MYFHAIGIDHFQVAFALPWRNYFHGTGVVGIHRPLSDIEVMSTHVGKPPIAVLTVTAPGREVVMHIIRTEDFIESTHRSWAEPSIPINSFRSWFGRKVAWLGWSTYAYTDFFQFPNRSAPYHFHGAAKFPSVFRALLTAGLKTTLFFLTASAMARPSLMVSEMGFSQYMCFLARAARMVASPCQ